MINTAFIAVSLDNFIAGEHGELDWLEQIPAPKDPRGEPSDYGFSEFLAGVDCLIMGRNTFESVCQLAPGDAWPYPVPVFVLSNRLTEIPKLYYDRVQLVSGPLWELLEQLQERDMNRAYIDGGKCIQSFLQQGLLHELILSRFPLLLGKGIPLFGEQQVFLQHCHSTSFANGIVQSHYKII